MKALVSFATKALGVAIGCCCVMISTAQAQLPNRENAKQINLIQINLVFYCLTPLLLNLVTKKS